MESLVKIKLTISFQDILIHNKPAFSANNPCRFTAIVTGH